MSTIIMSQCWPLQGLSVTQKAVLISLADQANDDGVCWPAVGTIAARCCMSARAVRTAMDHLEDDGAKRGLLNCMSAIQAASAEPSRTKVPYVKDMGSANEHYFAWPAGAGLVFSETGGSTNPASASCVTNAEGGESLWQVLNASGGVNILNETDGPDSAISDWGGSFTVNDTSPSAQTMSYRAVITSFTEQTVTHTSGSFQQQSITQSLSIISVEN